MNRFAAAVLVVAAAPAFAALVPSASKPEEVGFSSERLQRVREAVQRHIDANDVSGAVTLVARKGRIAHLEAQGLMDIEAKKPMPKDGIFRLASMSKPITGAAVMMLVEEGRIRLNDPISRFIPEFKNLNKVAVPKPVVPGAGGGGRGAPPAAGGRGGRGAAPEFDTVTANREIMIKDLLTHTSGLMSGGLGNGAAPQRTPTDTLATYIPKLAMVPLDFQPGTLWRYSGLAGFDVLGRVIEVASGQSFDQFLKQRLFDPLGMKDTGFYPSTDGASRLVTLYNRQGGTLARVEDQNGLTSRVYFSGAGGLMTTTAADYLQFAQMMLNGGQLNGKRFLGPRTIELMTSNHTGDMVNGQFGRPARGMGFGLSMQMVLDPVAADLRVGPGTFGWAGAYGCNVNMDPKENMVTIIMMQTSTPALQRDFENAVWQAIVE